MKRFTRPLASLLVLAPLAATAGKLIDRTVVTVNDEFILESDIEGLRQKLKSRSYQELLGVNEGALKSRDALLDLLVEEKIIDQQVKKLDLKATDQEVDGQIRAIVKRTGITQGQLAERLKQLGTTMPDYREGLRRQIERRNLVEREIKPTMEVSDEQLRHFYLRTSKPGEADLQYKIAHILISASKGGVSAPDRAKRVRKEAAIAPDDFERFVKEYSDDSGNLENGGVLGFFSLSSLAKEFREVVPKTKPGQVTQPIKTGAGYHIVKVLEARASDFSNLTKEQKDSLRNQMISAELEKRMAMWLERKKSEAHIRRAAMKRESDDP